MTGRIFFLSILSCCTITTSFLFAKNSPQKNILPLNETYALSPEDKSLTSLRTAYRTIFSHLHRTDIAPGAVIASPSKDHPNYFYHWVRDAGLTMLELVDLYRLPLPAERKKFIESLIQSWINFETQIQNTALAHSTLGEPIFTVHGQIYPHAWGRPQNDGPAIRALAMTLFAFELIRQNRMAEAKQLYRAELPAQSPIKRDLEYIAHHWRSPNFDLWEEVKGEHFFTKMAQRTALILGGQLARHYFNDSAAGTFYLNQARELELSIQAHIDTDKNLVVPTINFIGDSKGKNSGLDASVILAVLYFSLGDGFFDLHNPAILNTAKTLENVFSQIYSINSHVSKNQTLFPLSPGIGRYPEDVYNGAGFSEGNPWFITTNAFAEYHCRLAGSSPNKANASQLVTKGLGFINRTLLHSDTNGQMSEQFNRYNGYMQGARELTWSSMSYLRAYRACQTKNNYETTIFSLINNLQLIKQGAQDRHTDKNK